MRFLFLFAFILTQHILVAGNTDSIIVCGQVTPDSGFAWRPDKAPINLAPYNPDDGFYITHTDSLGNYSMKVAVTMPGVYDLKYKGYKVSLLLTPAEPVCKVLIKTDAQQEVHLMKISGSHENDAYRIFKRESAALKDFLRDARTECAGDGKNCFARYKKQLASQNELMEYMRMAYKGTYTASVLAPLGEVPELSNGQNVLNRLRTAFFDEAPLADTLLYRTPDLNNRLSLYIEYIADTTVTGRMQFLQQITSRVKDNREAQKRLLMVLLNNFLDNFREDWIQTLVQWAQAQPKFAEEQPILDAQIKLVAHMLPGLSAPDVTGENTAGKTLRLLATAKANKLTLLIFWDSECPHCRKAMPGFINLYKQYHPKGLEIFGASLDTEKDKWKAFINRYQLNWTNIVLPDNSSAHGDYFIQYTPTVVLIDNKGNIVKRFMAVEDTEQYIARMLQ